MCGIALARTDEHVHQILEKLAHRGKDDRRVIEWEGWWVGQNRLAIVDRDKDGEQPLKENQAVTTFNGEIYNYKEILEALKTKPQKNSEIGVLDVLMREHPEFWRILDGYYAIIRLHESQGRLSGIRLARDLFGVMPLYYATQNKKLVAAASEKKAIEDFGFIYEVPASTVIYFNPEGKRTGEDTFDPFSLHLEDVDEDHVEYLFRRAVVRRIKHSEVPVTISLSGGLDSALVAMAATNVYHMVDAITVGYEEDSEEVSNAKRLAEELGLLWTFVPLSESLVNEHLGKIKYHLEDYTNNPIKLRGMLRNYFVAKEAKGTVILCGEGADELAAGYPSHMRVGGGLALEWKVLSTIRSMPAINLDRVNKGGMAWTKEFRTPFLDRSLVLYLMGCKKEPGKMILRRLAKRIGVPDYILGKAKYGVEEKNLERLAGIK